MTHRIRAQHGNVIVGDFSRKQQPLELSLSIETLYADEFVIVLRVTIGNHSWHLLGDIATAKVIST